MDDILIQILVLALTGAFLSAAIMMRLARKSMEEMASRNTAVMMRMRDMITGKIRKFRR